MSVASNQQLSTAGHPPGGGAYGIRSLRALRQNQEPSVRLQKKIDTTYNYFLNTVDPIVGDLITHLLCEQPIDVPGAMLNYLTKLNVAEKAKEAKANGETEPPVKNPEDVRAEEEASNAQKEMEARENESKNKRNAKRPKKEQKLYLATSIGPVISKLVNRIANTRPKKVVNFMCEELQTLIYGSGEEKDARLVAEVESAAVFDMYKGQNGPKVEKPLTAAEAAAKRKAEGVEEPASALALPAAIELPLPDASSAHSLLGNDGPGPEITSSAVTKEVTAEAEAESNIVKYQFAVVGMDGVGKSSIMNMLQGSADKTTKPTIGFRPVTMMLGENAQVRFYDIGGGPKIREIWSQYYHDVHGVVYVVDSTEEGEKMAESVAQFNTTQEHAFISKKPLLILATKTDLEGTASKDDIAARYNLGAMPFARLETCKAVGAVEEVDANIEAGLEWVIEQVQGSFEQISTRVAADTVIKSKEDMKRRLARERKVLKTKISIAFIDLLSEENKPDLGDKPPNPEDAFTEEEGLNFLSSELGEEKENLPRTALEICAMAGYQRLALQIVGSLKVPISKKKDPMSWEEIHALIVEIRVELGLMMPNFDELNRAIQ